MNSQPPSETMREALVTYTAEIEGRIIVIEHVPARVCLETGEQTFSPETVDRIHAIIRGERPPARTVLIPIYEFAA
ncbi:MAG TPA: YgiT-type zinc finger protein [Tepidisphaeraceae bacterium]